MILGTGTLEGIVKTFTEMSVLPIVEWYLLFGMIRRLTGPGISGPAAFAPLVIFAVTTAVLHHQRTAFLFETLLLLAVWMRMPDLRRVAVILVLIAVQLGEGTTPLHGLFSWIDAHLVTGLMTMIGQPVLRIGNLIRSHGLPDGLVVLAGCASSKLMLPMGTGLAVLLLTSHPRLTRIDWYWIGATLAAAIVMNVIRLALMLQSHADFLSWHEGSGASLVSVVGLVITLAAWFAATAKNGVTA